MKFKSDIEVQAGLKDSSGAAGTSGQVLSSNGTTVSWVNAGESTASDVQNQVKAGVAINKGQAVYVTSADGTNIIVGLASNTAEATSSKTLGLLDATVAINGMANVVQIGRLAGLNTIGANAGDPVWLGTNGNLIYGLVNKPYAPAHLVYIGVVTRVNANNGEIFINVQNGFELDELHNVSARTPSNNNGIFYNTSTSLWEAKSISAAGGVEGTGASGQVAYWNGTSTITGESNLFWDSTNDRLGIGTATPSFPLHLYKASSDVLLALQKGTSFGYVVNDGTNILLGSDAGTTGYKFLVNMSAPDNSMIINSSGNVGLGITPRAWQNIYRAIELPSGVSLIGRNDGGIEGQLITNAFRNSSGSYIYANNGISRRYVQESDGHIWFNAPSGTAGNAISFTQAMTLFSNGNLAVGPTTDAGYKLDVNGSSRFYANGQILSLKSTTNNGSYIEFEHNSAGSYGYIGNAYHLLVSPYNVNTDFAIRAEGALYFTTGGYTPRLTIATTGAATFSSSATATVFTAPNINVSANNGMYDAGTNAVGIQTNGAARLIISSTGTATFSNLAGTGSRMVVADAAGLLSTQTIPTGTITGSGTTNYIPKFTSSSAIGDSLIYNGTASIGINTTSTDQLLTLSQTINNTTIGLYNTNANTGNRNWTVGTNDLVYGDFAIIQSNANGGNPVAAGTKRFYINPSGNVGIGSTVDNGVKLYVESQGEYIARFKGPGDGTIIIGGADASSGEQYITYQNGTTATNAWMVGMDDDEQFKFSYGAAGEITDPNTKMAILQNGNILVGTVIDAGYKLDVNGKSRFGNSLLVNASAPNDWGLSVFGNTTTGQSYGGIIRGGTDSSDVAFKVNNAANSVAYLNVRGDGNIGINTITPASKLDIVDSSGTFATRITNNQDSSQGLQVRTSDNDSSLYILDLQSSSTATGTDYASKLLVAKNGGITASSLSGSGSRMVVASATGLLSTQAIPTGTVTGSGTTNYVPKFTSASAIGNSQIFDNGTSVGIGTPAPSGKLEVAGSIFINGTNSTLELGDIATYSSIGYNGSIDYLDIKHKYTSGGIRLLVNTSTEAMRIFQSANVFIGSSPTDAGYKLDVNGNIRMFGSTDMSSTIETTGTNNAATLVLKSGNGTSSGLYSYLRFINNNTNQQEWRLGTYGNNNFTFVNLKVGTTPVIINTSGEVSIAASSAGSSLTVYGRPNDWATVINGNATTSQAYGLKVKAGTNSSDNSFLVSNTSDAQLFRVRGDGNVAIGTTNPSAKLEVLQANGNGLTSGFSGIHVMQSNASVSEDVAARMTFNADGGATVYGFIEQRRNASDSLALGTRNSTGGAGYVSIVTQGTEKMRVFGNGNVGINTITDAGYKLDVNGNSRCSGILRISKDVPALQLFNTTNGDNWATVQAEASTGTGGQLAIYTKRNGNTETVKIRVTENGNTLFYPNLPIAMSGQGAAYYGSNITLASDIGSTQGANRIWSRYDATGRACISFETATNSQSYMSDPTGLTYTEYMRISGSGYVGIGTGAPTQAKLVVKSSGDASTTVDGIVLQRNGTTAKLIRLYEQSADGYLEVRTGNDEIITKLSGWGGTPSYFQSRLGVGTTEPVYSLDVNGGSTGGAAFRAYKQSAAGNGEVGMFINTSATGYSSYIYIGSAPGTDWKIGKNISNPGSAVYHFEIVDSSNNLRMQINNGTGNVTFSSSVTATGFFNSSDIRLKEIVDYDYNISDIKPISYLWKDLRDNKKHIGYSAQEVQKVMPDAVEVSESGMLSVNYIEVLVAKIAELENRIKQLEK